MRFCLPSAALVIVLCGCGGPSMATVKGRVTCKGIPVKDASIVFSPVPKSGEDNKPGKPATGHTDEKGEYILSTFKNYDGALLGTHDVTVSLDDANPARCPRKTQLVLDVKPGSNEHDIELHK